MRIPLLLIAITWQVVSTSSQRFRGHRVSRTLETFADRTLKVIAEDQYGNFVYSSISLAMILSMASVGAAGKTRDQLVSAIERPYSKAPQRANEPSERNSDHLNGFVLRVANKIFLSEGFTPRHQFSSVMMTLYRSPPQTVDFSMPVQASKTINDWSAAQTNNRIKQIVQPADLSSETSLVLANTVYFKGSWVNAFNRERTSMLPFYINRSTVKRVPTMRHVGNYNYGKLPEVNAKFIELPYVRTINNQVMSMFVILPDEVDGLGELIRNFEKVTAQKLYNGEMWAVELSLPKFKVETKLDLEPALRKLGLTEMFRPSADFSGITVERPLTVSKVVQRTVIEVNEQGTEAASATGMHMESRLQAVPEVTFSVDRPFISVIANRIGMPYFTAVIVDPTSKD